MVLLCHPAVCWISASVHGNTYSIIDAYYQTSNRTLKISKRTAKISVDITILLFMTI